MTEENAFFQLYNNLHREGPGDRESLDWALAKIDLAKDAMICDAGCGSGADLGALLEHVPSGHVIGVDTHEPFLQEAAARYENEPRIRLHHGNYATIGGPLDLIWSAGAIYFVGITVALKQWRDVVKEDGAVIFSQLYWKTDKPSDVASELWQEYGHMPFEADVYDQVRQGGFEVVAARALPDAAWEEYYKPLEVRIEEVQDGASEELAAVIKETRTEIDTWRSHGDEFGYLQVVAKPG